MIAIESRPFRFSEICGQKGIVGEMKKRSLTHDWPNVMLLVGDSGTGKSTIAYIIAALINDPNPIKNEDCLDPNPESVPCKDILKERFARDVSYFDASRMGKEDVLKLEELVSSSPMFDDNRVIIIDEAQELSKTSKGVTLKLLEKKRKDVFIILCTMNPDAFDTSIRGRGLLYTFRSPTTADIATNLFGLAERLGQKLPDEFLDGGIFAIADNCEGSVRMSVQMLERCIMGGFWSAADIEREFGILSGSRASEIACGLIAKKKDAFSDLKKMDPKEFFYASYKFLSEAVIFLRTGYSEASWKEAQFQGLASKKEGVEKLFNLYADIDIKMGGYFRPSYFLARLTEIYETKDAAPAAVPAQQTKTR